MVSGLRASFLAAVPDCLTPRSVPICLREHGECSTDAQYLDNYVVAKASDLPAHILYEFDRRFQGPLRLGEVWRVAAVRQLEALDGP